MKEGTEEGWKRRRERRKGDSRVFGFVCKRRRRERRETRGLVDLDLCASLLCNLREKKDTLIFLYSSPLCLQGLASHAYTHPRRAKCRSKRVREGKDIYIYRHGPYFFKDFGLRGSLYMHT